MHALTRAVAPVLATALSLACTDASSPAMNRAALGSRVSVWVPESTAVLVHADYSGLGDAARLLITDSQSFSRIWTQVYTGLQPQPPLPTVDFGTEAVLLAALGRRSTGGYDIRIDSLVRFAHGSVAYVTSRAPGKTCVTTQALTHPVELLRLAPAPVEPLAFDEQAVVVDCASLGH